MPIYFEHLSFRVALAKLCKELTLRNKNKSKRNTYYYIDISYAGRLLVKYFNRFFKLEVK